MSVPVLDIVIVNWNAGKYLKKCLESVSGALSDEIRLNRIVVVDNCSTDGSVDGLNDLALPLIIIRNNENRGFAAACNQGATGSEADYLLFLNPDTRIFSDSLLTPILFLEDVENTRYGICGIRLIDENGKPSAVCARFPTLGLFLSEMVGLPRILPRRFTSHIMHSYELFKNREVDQVMGSFFLVRAKLFHQAGAFDERFFVYFEEVDLSLRLKQAGYGSYYLAVVDAIHIGRASSRQVSSTALFYSLSSRLKYAWKHFKAWEALTLTILTFLVEFPLRIIWVIGGSKDMEISGVWYAYKRLGLSFIVGDPGCR